MPCNQLKKPVLTIEVSVHGQEKLCLVEDLELSSEDMRHRISSMKANRTIQDILHSKLANFILDVLSRLDGERVVFADGDAFLQIKDIRLRGLQVLSATRDTGEQRLSFRFLEAEGNVQTLLREVVTRTQAETKAIAMEAIERVVGRTYGVTQVLENVRGMAEPATEFAGYTDDILRKRKQLLFRLELLRRSVADQYVQGETEAEIERLIASA